MEYGTFHTSWLVFLTPIENNKIIAPATVTGLKDPPPRLYFCSDVKELYTSMLFRLDLKKVHVS